MPPILSIVGKSNSGKTTLLESLIAEMKQRGYKVAVIKHAGEDIELDTVNKDTWRFSRAGSDISAINAGQKLAIFRAVARDFNAGDLATFICGDYDLLLTEGFKQSDYPKIEVHRKEQGKDLVSPPEQLIAIVTDEPVEASVPRFGKDEARKIVDFIVETILRPGAKDINLFINDEPVALKPAARDLLSRTLIAMAPGIKSVSDIKSLRVSLRRRI